MEERGERRERVADLTKGLLLHHNPRTVAVRIADGARKHRGTGGHMRIRSGNRNGGRIRASAALMLALSLLVGACTSDPDEDESSPGSDRQLVINSFGGTWGSNLELGLVQDFESASGIDVTVLSTWDVAASRAAVESGNEPPEDLLDSTLPIAVPLERDGLLADIDYDVFDQATLDQLPDYAEHSYSVAWGQFAMGICFDKRVFPDGEPQPSNWADFWDVASFPGTRGMLEWPAEPMPEAALIADGVSPDQLYPLDLDRAFASMDQLRPNVPRFAPDPSTLMQMLVDGQVVMAACPTHRGQTLVDGGLPLGISFDQARIQTAEFEVWKNAPNADEAMEFLAFITQPEQQARWAQIADAAPINPAAYDFIPEEVANALPTAPSNDTVFVKDDDWYSEPSDADSSMTNFEYIIQRWSEWVAGG